MEIDYNQYHILSVIDGILDRVHMVDPMRADLDHSSSRKFSGEQYAKFRQVEREILSTTTQYLFLCNSNDSLERELVAWSTDLYDPIFDVFQSKDPRIEPFRPYYIPLVDYTSRPPQHLEFDGDTLVLVDTNIPRLQKTDLPLPRPQGEQTAYRVSYHLLHSLSGLRAVLLNLIDSCGKCAKDEDFIGRQPVSDSLWALYEMRTWKEEDFVSNAKYWKDWPLARFLRNPLPPMPSSWSHGPEGVLFRGETGDYLRRLATFSSTRPDSTFVYRALFGHSQTKRGFAPVPEVFVSDALRKHARKLSTPPPTTLGGPDSFDIELARVFALSVFKSFEFPEVFASAARLEPSTSASVYTTRTSGGTRESIRSEGSRYFGTGAVDMNVPMDFDDPSGKNFSGWNSEEGGEAPVAAYSSEKHHFLGFRELAPGQIVEERGTYPLSEDDWRALAVEWVNNPPTYSRLPAHHHTALANRSKQKDPEAFRFRAEHIRNRPFARVAAILEPLKVRTITAMDPVLAHLARPLQQALWDHLRQFPVFSLIGEPISEDLLHDLNTRHRKLSPLLGLSSDDSSWVSGDYSAATDGLDLRLSKLFLETLMEKIPSEDIILRKVFRNVLLEQVILYPPNSRVSPIIQKNGQLMGSVLSFPFLCLANLFAYAMALGRGDREVQKRIVYDRRLLKKLPVLINGDDILFRAGNDLYTHWKREIAKVGFSLSVGKNFIHPRFFTVNSVPIEFRPSPATNQEFWGKMSWADMADLERDMPGYPSYRPDTLTDTFTIGGFLNVGLLTGQAKLTGRSALRTIPLSGWHAQSVLTALNPAQAHRWFLHYHKSSIQRQTRFGGTTLNIFAHPLKGGLGFAVPPGIEPRYSPEQRRLAEALFLSMSVSISANENEVELDPLVSISGQSTGAPLLGRKRRRVDLQPFPINTPLPEGFSPYKPLIGESRRALTMPYGVLIDPEDDTQVTCRLSGRQIRKLTRRFGETVPLHPLEAMTQFPFILVNRPESSLDAHQTVYSPEIFLQDVPHPDVPGDLLQPEEGDHTILPLPPLDPEDPLVSDDEPSTQGRLDDWETQVFAIDYTADLEQELVDVGPLPTFNVATRSHAGRLRRRRDLAVPNAARRSSRVDEPL